MDNQSKYTHNMKPKILEDDPVLDSTDFDSNSMISQKSFSFSQRSQVVNKSFDDLNIMRYIHRGTTDIFLAVSRTLKQKFVMKVFKYSANEPSSLYLNELRFFDFQHSNIIKFHHFENKKETIKDDTTEVYSYIITEYASAGDFYDLLVNNRITFDEKLARTFFQQLIKGIESLHVSGIAHLDIKLENLLLGDDLQLKIIDFGHAWIEGDENIRSRGSKLYAAPELEEKRCENPFAADIFSCGAVLFLLVARGVPIQHKYPNVKAKDMYELLQENSSEFWSAHSLNNPALKSASSDFKDLIEQCLAKDPKKRLTVSQIQETRWFRGEIFPKNELRGIIDSYKIFNTY